MIVNRLLHSRTEPAGRRVRHFVRLGVLTSLFAGSWMIVGPTASFTAPLSVGAFRTASYRGVDVAVPVGMARVPRASFSTCEVVSRPAVYVGALSDGGLCGMAVSPGLLAVTLSPIDAYSSPSMVAWRRVVLTKVVKSRGVIVGVWFGSDRRADAEKILTGVHT
jgi:hypothetical protein